MRIVLASGSPRRKELLGRICPRFDIIKSQKEEKTSAVRPFAVVKALAAQKAREVADCCAAPVAVIGSDTVVAVGNVILGKPRDAADAMRMLSLLSGRTHYVYTGVCVIIKDEKGCRERVYYERSGVVMREIGEREAGEYVATGEPMDKAGAYAVQGGAAKFVEKVLGDYDTVVGLPVGSLEALLREEGVI